MSASTSPFNLTGTERRLLAVAPRARAQLIVVLALITVGGVAVVVQAVALGDLVTALTHHGVGASAPAWRFGGSLGAAALAAAGIDVVATRFAGDAAETLVAATFASLTATQRLSPARVGGLTTALTSGLDGLDAYFRRFLPALLQCAVVPIGLIGWIASRQPLAAAILLVVALTLPLAMAIVGRRSGGAAAAQWRSLHALSSRYFELLDGLTTLRLLNRVDAAAAEVTAATASFGATTMKVLALAFRSALVVEFASGVAVGLVAMEVGFGLLDGTTSLATAVAITVVAAEVLVPLRRVGAEFHAVQGATAAATAVFDHLATSAAARPRERCQDGVSLDGIVLRLGEGRTIGPLTAAARPGSPLEVTGPSGVGKSTLLAALCGLTDPVAGTIGVPDPTGPVAYAPQSTYLLATSLSENLRVAAPEASDDEVDRTARRVGLGDLLDALPRGLDTPVGDGGVQLSAGELRKVGVARVLLSRAALCVVDEPFANLDEQSTSEVRMVLADLAATRTLVLAHHGVAPALAAATILRVVAT